MEIYQNVHAITGMAVNCFLIVEADGLVMIDTGLRNYQRKIISYLESLGFTAADVRHILITHADGDHVGSLSAIRDLSQAASYASQVEARAIGAGESSRELKFTGLAGIVVDLLGGLFAFDALQVDQIVSPGQELPFLEGLKVLSTPGHTPGHTSYFSAATGILFAGDSMRATRQGLIASRGANTWDEALALESVRLQAQLKPQLVCVGHGPVVTNAAGKFPRT